MPPRRQPAPRGPRSSRITVNNSSTTSAGAPDPRDSPGRRARASLATRTASGCPRANARIRVASSPLMPWAARSRSTSPGRSGPTANSPSSRRHPGAVRQATFGPRRPTSRVDTVAGRAPIRSLRIQPSSRLSRSKLSNTRPSTPAAASCSAAPVADGGADPPSAAPIARSAPGTVGSIRRPSRVTDFSGSAASVSPTRTVLPIPPGPCTNTAASPCEESIAPRRARSSTRPTRAAVSAAASRSETVPSGRV